MRTRNRIDTTKIEIDINISLLFSQTVKNPSYKIASRYTYKRKYKANIKPV